VQRLIFLDMDGVITHPGSGFHIDPVCVDRLNLLIEQTAAQVVISSSWRLIFELDDIEDQLASAGFEGEVVGQTPWIPDENRGREIETYLEGLKGSVRYVILDDDPDVAPLTDRLVHTDGYLGLQDEDLEEAIAMLG
jgi:hypothetical protein